MRKRWKSGLALMTSLTLLFPTGSVFAANQVSIEQNGKDINQLLLPEKEKRKNAYIANKENNEMVSADLLIIKYNQRLSKTVHTKAGTKLVRSLPALGYDVVQVPKGKKVNDVIAVYKKEKMITSITPSFKYKKLAAATDDVKKNKMYHLQMLQINEAVKLAGKHDVTVAIVDSGVDFKHADLKAQLLPPYNAASPASMPVRDLHGTHVAGIVASTANNEIGGHGINPKAKILPVDVFNGKMAAYDYNIAEGIMYAVNQGADVINLSLGGYGASPLMKEAIEKAIDSGVVVVAAAGNESTDEYSYPAAFPGVISVGNINKDKLLSQTSNYGPSVDLVAPGEDIYNTAYEPNKGSTFMTLTGTSMASPMVAGAASLLKSKYPNLTPYQVEVILEKTAVDLGSKGFDPTFGNGLVNPLAALKFDIKNLPKKETLSEEEILEAASELKDSNEDIRKGALKSPEEVHWFKIDLKENEHLQTTLEAAENYDYGMDFYFYPDSMDGQADEPIQVNKVKAGQIEGHLFSAPEAGTLVVGVKDVNGNYDVSGKSSYTFTAKKAGTLEANTNSFESPIEIKKLPYTTAEEEEPMRIFASELGMPDYDYYKINVQEPTVLSISLSELPGVNTSLAVTTSEPGLELEEEMLMARADENGVGKGERLSLEAIPGIDYIITVSNESVGDLMGDLSFLGLLGGGFAEVISFDNSSEPYELKVEEVVLPEDEDGLPLGMNLEEAVLTGEITNEEYVNKKAEEVEQETDIISGEQEELPEVTEGQMILKQAIPISADAEHKGYFQIAGDEDYYSFTPKENAVYNLAVHKGSNQMPVTTLFEYDEESKELIPVADYSENILGLLMEILGGMGQGTSHIALKKDTQYVIKVVNEFYNISADAYSLELKKVASTPDEEDKDMNDPAQAVNVRAGQAYKNYFIYSGDTDFYYFKSDEKNNIHQLRMYSPPLTAAEKKAVPAALREPVVFSGMLVEDTNGDKVLDSDEMNKAIPFGPSLLDLTFETEVNLSFKSKKDAGYFVIVSPLFSQQPSLQPYTMKISDVKSKLLDGDGKVINHVPVKPLNLKKINGKLGVHGYINAEVPFGDIDHFKLEVKKDSTVSFSLQMENPLDGKIEVYNAKGSLVASFDHYGNGDDEIAKLKMKKGTYYIEISESLGRSSTEPYKFYVSK